MFGCFLSPCLRFLGFLEFENGKGPEWALRGNCVAGMGSIDSYSWCLKILGWL